MKVEESPSWARPQSGLMEWATSFLRSLSEHWLRMAQQVNGVSEGRINSALTASTAAPTTGSWIKGDFVRNSDPSEAGSGGSAYVVTGWVCVASGTPGTWLACRSLTGN